MQTPDVIYFNGEVHAFDLDENVYEALAVKKGRIIAVGSNDTICSFQSKETRLINLHHKTVIPGFIDAHIHLFKLGFNLSYVDCRLDSIGAVRQAIWERAKMCKNQEEWIIGWGFDESLYKEGRKLNKWDFEDIKNPVYITRYCLHEAVVNEAAMRRTGITNSTEINNGIIEKDKTGEATGLLIEKAMSLAEDALPPYTEESMEKAIRLANQHLIKNGITGVHEAGMGFLIDPYMEFNVLEQMSKAGTLHVRMYLMILGEYFKDFMETHQHVGTEKLKLGSMKLFADGTLSGQTAAVMEPYKETEIKGMLLHSDAYYEEYLALAQELNKQVAIHAIGDRAIDQVLRIFEIHPRRDLRHRIEHTTLSNEMILKRMKDLHAIPIPQPLLLHMAGDMYELKDEFLENVFAVKSFVDNNLMPAGSSDAPVVDCNPLLGIYAAMTRETLTGKVIGKDQKIMLKDAIKMYTINAAHASFEEGNKGSIETGKFADFTILPEGFMQYSAEEVKQTKIEMTIINGQIIYRNSNMNHPGV
jgi:predicted amidohydrolase YtcJ